MVTLDAMQPAALSEVLQETLTFPTVNDAQKAAQREIMSALQSALEARIGLLLTGLCVLITTALVHLDNRRNCGIAVALFATGMAVSLLLVASHSRPFTGEISIGPDLLQQIAGHVAPSSAP